MPTDDFMWKRFLLNPNWLQSPNTPASHNSGKLVQFCQYWIAWYSSANDIQQLFFGKSTFYSSKNSTFLELLAIQFLTWFIPSCIQEYISQTTCRYSRIYQSRHSSRRKFQRLKRRGNTSSKPSHPFKTQPLKSQEALNLLKGERPAAFCPLGCWWQVTMTVKCREREM